MVGSDFPSGKQKPLKLGIDFRLIRERTTLLLTSTFSIACTSELVLTGSHFVVGSGDAVACGSGGLSGILSHCGVPVTG